MRRLLTIWLTLLAAFWFTRAAVSALLFQSADLSERAVFQLVTVPVLQALLVGWLTRDPGRVPLLTPLRAALVHPAVRVALGIDLLLVLAGAVFHHGPGLGPAPPSVPAGWVGLKLLAAGGLLVLLSRRGDEGERLRLGVLASSLAVLGVVGAVGFLDWSGVLLARWLPDASPVALWLFTRGPLAVVAAAALLEVQDLFRTADPGAARAFDWALGLGLLAALVTVLDLFALPYPAAPWGPLATACAALGSTALLIGLALAGGWTEARD